MFKGKSSSESAIDCRGTPRKSPSALQSVLMFISWDEQLLELVLLKKWKEVLPLGAQLSLDEKSRYLWAWPTMDSLKFLQEVLNSVGVSHVLSIGCGSGLLEWIIQESIGVDVKGVELDNSWWTSSYSPKTFVRLSYVEEAITSEFLMKACDSGEWNFALLFCYFNDHKAFVEYLKKYQGKHLIIIGPGSKCGRHTDPKPFEPGFIDDNVWKLDRWCEIGHSDDFIAFYVK